MSFILYWFPYSTERERRERERERCETFALALRIHFQITTKTNKIKLSLRIFPLLLLLFFFGITLLLRAFARVTCLRMWRRRLWVPPQTCSLPCARTALHPWESPRQRQSNWPGWVKRASAPPPWVARNCCFLLRLRFSWPCWSLSSTLWPVLSFLSSADDSSAIPYDDATTKKKKTMTMTTHSHVVAAHSCILDAALGLSCRWNSSSSSLSLKALSPTHPMNKWCNVFVLCSVSLTVSFSSEKLCIKWSNAHRHRFSPNGCVSQWFASPLLSS